jgi:membrane associated rhomboid family serine protease
MNLKQLPIITMVLALATITTSLAVNYSISGTLIGKIRVIDLEPYGGFTIEHIMNFELWRLLVSQLIHTKQIHMFYNVLSLFALGFLLERKLGGINFFLIWFLAGSVGTFVSTFTVPAPWNLGTGGSQAILALAASGLILHKLENYKRHILAMVLILTIVPAFLLDLIYASNHLPKLGHIASFVLGLILGFVLLRRGSVTASY